MALKVEDLKRVESLKGVTDEQLKVIAVMSGNDEQSVIDKKVKEIHDRYDADVKAITGEEKAGGVKSYDHLKVVLGNYKKKAEEKVDTKALDDEILKLKGQIKEGSGDKKMIEDLEQKVRDKEGEVATIKKTYEEEKVNSENALKESQSKFLKLEINHQFDKHVADNGIKFLSTIPKEIVQETLAARKARLLGTVKADYIDAGKGDGTKKLVFRDEQGEILRNKDNKFEPFTAGELYINTIGDLVDGGRKAGGGGGNPPRGGGGGGGSLDLSTAKTQVEADDMIRTHIHKDLGIAKTDPKFQESHAKLRIDAKVADLPVK